MGSCLSVRIKAESPIYAGSTASKYPSVPLTPRSQEEILESSNLKNFAFNDLREATRNFRPDTVLGEGGFGCVFKGWIDENTFQAAKPGTGLVIAAKRLRQEGHQGHKEWLAEINYLGQLYHPNLVKLIGYCLEDEHRLLVYEFMPRGSLENHLFRSEFSISLASRPGNLIIMAFGLSVFHEIDESQIYHHSLSDITETGGSHFQPLSWNLRMRIAFGAAKGLEYLHSPEAKVIYRDFKSSNILIDSKYNAKLSDFGLAKDGPEDGKSHVSTRVMGTYGYAAPEYMVTGHLTTKSDIYSFGVVLLEMLTGRRVVDNNRPPREHNLIPWAKPHLSSKRRIMSVMDPRLEGQYPVGAALRAASLALKCISVEPRSRPDMDYVVKALEQLQDMRNSGIIRSNAPQKHRRT